MRLDGVPRTVAWCALVSACLTPFLFGAVERSVWIPLCQLWLVLGLAVSLAQARQATSLELPGTAISRALLPIHALFLVQLTPLPAAILRVVSPGSVAAHFLPDPGDGRFRPISVSPSATLEAWLYFAGLQGLFLALQALPRRRRPTAAGMLLGGILLLAAEGLWQSRSAHPSWLYSRIPVLAPSGLDTASFGPYLNRNHFAAAMALGAGWAAGLAVALVRERGGARRLLADSSATTRAVWLAGSSLFLLMASTASGSRSGTAASIGAIAATLAAGVGTRRLLLPLGLAFSALALTGPAAIERLMRLDLVTARWAPWRDMTRLLRFFPVLGSGIGTFGVAYWPYQTNATYEFWQHAHNEYLQWPIETGVTGLLVVVLSGGALRRAAGIGLDSREAVLGATSAIALQSLLDFPFRVPANAALLVCVLGLTAVRRND